MEQPTCLAIDLKSYYASAECAARHLDPLTTHLVVADESRTEKTICLAVSPSLKAYGLPGRARLFEVLQKLKEVNAGRLSEAIRLGRAIQKNGMPSLTDSSFNSKALQADPSLKASCIIAPPRMAYYEKLSRQIYGIYLKYIAPEDIVVYSIDEVFMDVSSYLAHYRMTARQLAKKLVQEVQHATGITATAGIGTNLYLAKLAMDITAKHAKPDKEGVRIAELNEESFRYLLWDHRPLTDFWHTGPAIARRLEHHGIHTMGELARISLQYPEILYDEFGIDAEILIDHAWGVEPCTIKNIKSYKPENSSFSEGQVLGCSYPYEKALIIIQEMADSLALSLADKHLVTDGLTLDISYGRENYTQGAYQGQLRTDHYGRSISKKCPWIGAFSQSHQPWKPDHSSCRRSVQKNRRSVPYCPPGQSHCQPHCPGRRYFSGGSFYGHQPPGKRKTTSGSHAGHQKEIWKKCGFKRHQLLRRRHHAGA